MALGVSGQYAIRCGKRMAVAAVYGVERVVILGAGLVLVTGNFEGRVDEQVVRGRDGVGHGAEVNWNAVGLLGVGDFILLRDFGNLREITVGIGDEFNVGDDGERPLPALDEGENWSACGGCGVNRAVLGYVFHVER